MKVRAFFFLFSPLCLQFDKSLLPVSTSVHRLSPSLSSFTFPHLLILHIFYLMPLLSIHLPSLKVCSHLHQPFFWFLPNVIFYFLSLFLFELSDTSKTNF